MAKKTNANNDNTIEEKKRQKRKVSNQRVQMRLIDLENMRMSLKDENNGLG